MAASRGKFPLLLTMAAGLFAAAGAAYAYRNAFLEWWHLRLLHSLDSTNWPSAAERLGELRSARAVPRLIDLLPSVSPNPEDLFSGPLPYARALLEIGEPAAPALVDTLRTSERRRPTIETILLEIGKPAVPPLAATLAEKGEWNRTRVLDLMERFGPRATEAVPALIRCLGDEAGEVSSRAAKVLATIGKEAGAAVPALLAALEHRNSATARAAARALGRIDPRNPSVAPALRASLNEAEDPQSRIVFAWVLAGIDRADPAPVLALRKVMEEEQPSHSFRTQVRLQALRALADLGTRARDAIPFLEDSVRNGGDLREETEAALKRIYPMAERGQER